jgi:hypothetical protein
VCEESGVEGVGSVWGELSGGCVKCVRRVEWRVCEVCEESGEEGVWSVWGESRKLLSVWRCWSLALPHNLKQRLAEGGQPTGRRGCNCLKGPRTKKPCIIYPPGTRTLKSLLTNISYKTTSKIIMVKIVLLPPSIYRARSYSNTAVQFFSGGSK